MVVVVGAYASALLVVVSSVGVVGVSYVAADRLVHPPRDLREVTPSHRGLPYEEVSLATEDGLRLAAWWIPARGEALGTVVFLHGYGASKAQSLAVAPFLHRGGWNVLAFDFRAHGWSEGSHTTFGIDEVADVRAALAWLGHREKGAGPIALFGWSMGAATALLAASELPQVRAVVADSAFARLENVVANSLPAYTGLPAFPFAPVTVAIASWMTRHDVDDAEPARAAALLQRPLLIIHGLDDDLVRPGVDAVELDRAAGGKAEVWLVPGAEHVDARRHDPREYEHRVLRFLFAHVAGLPAAAA